MDVASNTLLIITWAADLYSNYKISNKFRVTKFTLAITWTHLFYIYIYIYIYSDTEELLQTTYKLKQNFDKSIRIK